MGVEVAIIWSEDTPYLDEWRLSISGGALSHIKKRRLTKLLRYIRASGAKCTRLDWAIDDFDRSLNLDDILTACKEGNYSGFLRYSSIESWDGKWGTGRTLYLGSSQADKMIRVYDKNVESKGKVPSIRLEGQYRDGYAEAMWQALCGCIDGRGGYNGKLNSFCVGGIDFIERKSSVRSRCPRLQWWAEWIEKLGGSSRMSVPKVQTLVSDKKRWIEKQVVGTLAVLRKVMGTVESIEWLSNAIAKKAENMSDSAKAFCRTCVDRLKVETMEFEEAMEYHAYCRSMEDIWRSPGYG
jgi:DNA relaxase NicK